MLRLRGPHFFLLLILFPIQVLAYNFTTDYNMGFYWKSFPIHIPRFAANASEGTQLQEITDRAEQAWEDIVATNLWTYDGDVIIGGPAGGNNIRWSDNFQAETGYDQGSTLAITIRYQDGPYFVKTEIILNGTLSILRDNVNNYLYKTIVHEMGHTLGIGHSDAHSIMAPYISSIENPTDDDIDAIENIVADTIYRQNTGFISQYAQQQEESSNSIFGPTCGNISLNGNGPGGGDGNAALSFIVSLLIGALSLSFLRALTKSPIFSLQLLR